MSALSEFQSQFVRVIAQGEESAPGMNARYRSYPAEVALAVYRNNYRGNLRDALASAYPVLEQLVGEEYFSLMARKYIGQHPSRSGNLHRYGAEMAHVLANFEPAHGLAYLPDVAALEWACHCAYFADDADALDLGKLAQVTPESYPDMLLHLHPACRLVRSRFPIAAIWHAHQQEVGRSFHIDLDAGPCNALACRKGDVVQVGELSEAEALWFEGVQSACALGAATELTLENHSDFDLRSALIKLLQLGVLVDGELPI